jgi:rhodanese-related sulfurtransferase
MCKKQGEYMKIAAIVAATVLVLGGGFFLFSEPSQDGDVQASVSDQQSSGAVTYDQIIADTEEGALFLDVRTPEEYAQGYYQGAELFPLVDIQTGQLPDTAKDTKIYVYCRSGNRSAQATASLRNAGFSNIVDLGGLVDVEKIGGTLVN